MAAPAPSQPKKIPPRLRTRLSPLRAGVLASILIVVATFLAFSKQLPWGQPFELSAVFQTSNNIRLDSPVRIAGVDVGKVTDVKRVDGSNLVAVTMEMDDSGLPIHRDARLTIRSRIFLEGNFFMDLQPGTAAAPKVEDGDRLPVTQTSSPVQLDQVLTALQQNDREALQDLLQGLGSGLSDPPTAAADADQDPATRGETAAKSLNDSLDYAPDALKNSARVNQALLGTKSGDLSGAVRGLEKIVTALAGNEEQLKDFVTNFNRFFAVFAAEQQNLERSIAELGPTLDTADTAFASLDRMLPQLGQFARNLAPGVEETPATITAMTPWIAQAQRFFSPSEGGGLLRALRPAVQSLAVTVDQSFDLFRQTDRLSRCFDRVVIPASETVLQDGSSTSGVPSWKEFWYTMVAFAGDAQGFDGNGSYTRTATGGGGTLIQSQQLRDRPAGRGQLFGNAIAPPQGTRPPRPSKAPPFETGKACYKQAQPNLNGPAAGPGPGDKVVADK